MAKVSAQKLGLRRNEFIVKDLCSGEIDTEKFDEILMLDVLHHVPLSRHEPLVQRCFDLLNAGGCLIVKDIHRGSSFKLFFTWILDMLMTNWEPVHYRSRKELLELLYSVGFDQVLVILIDDLLPYPHVQYVCIKA